MLIAVQPIRDLACSYKYRDGIEGLKTKIPGSTNIKNIQTTGNIYLHGSSATPCKKVPMLELNQGRLESLPSRRRSGERRHQNRVHPARSPLGTSRLVTYKSNQ
jgi:hypothetical protein